MTDQMLSNGDNESKRIVPSPYCKEDNDCKKFCEIGLYYSCINGICVCSNLDS